MEAMEEYRVVQQNSQQLKVLFYLNELNLHWRRYDALVRGQMDLPREAIEEEKRIANISYEYAELQLAKLGYHYSQLKYDQETLTWSLPD